MPTGLQDNGFFSDEAASINAEIKTDYKQLFFYLHLVPHIVFTGRFGHN